MKLDRLVGQLKRHEGYRRYPYRDIAGILTIGYGRNLQVKGIGEAEAEMLLLNDIRAAEAGCRAALAFFDQLDDLRQEVLVNMCVNLGLFGLQKFAKMLCALEKGDYFAAATEMRRSKWALQVKSRAVELAGQMGQDVSVKDKPQDQQDDRDGQK